jgi:hypothetical protein
VCVLGCIHTHTHTHTHTHKYIKPEIRIGVCVLGCIHLHTHTQIYQARDGCARVRIDELTICTCSRVDVARCHSTHRTNTASKLIDARVRIDELTSCTCSRVDVESTIATHTYSMYVIQYVSTSYTQHTYSMFVIQYLSTVARTHTVCMSYSIVCTRRTDKDRVLALFELKASS